ncbi:thermonuclease family protein [Paenibacillus sp. GCM10023252]|uniref:thermonuclease family protein n=1 Tax=Paenibacillus sp. GCM10023252 TaxID=3252649 RepID=UPI00360BE671
MNRLFIALILMILQTGCAGTASTEPMAGQPLQEDTWYPVTDTVDGDTFKIEVHGEQETIRLLYVDTPETKKPKTPVQPLGPEASDYTKRALEQSGEVKLAFDREPTDRYGRVLAVVTLRDGTVLNETLLNKGLARTMIIAPNVALEESYKLLERKARSTDKGIWGLDHDSAGASPSPKPGASGITMEVDKRGETVLLRNLSAKAIALEGWRLVSVRGEQSFQFPSYELRPGASVTVSSTKTSSSSKPASNSTTLQWEASNIWNNTESDPARLYTAEGTLAAQWADVE